MECFIKFRFCNRRLLLMMILNLGCLGMLYSQPDTVKVGLYITNLYDFNIGDDAFTTEFWMWTNYKNDEISFESSPEVKGAKKVFFSNYFVQEKGGYQWMQKKCNAVVIQDWDVRFFPFDKQVLKIRLEETEKDASEVVYSVDNENTKLDSQLVIEEFKIDSIRSKDILTEYNTTYGDPTLKGTSIYSGVEVEIYMMRISSWMLLIKMTTGLYVAFLISLLVFTILPPDSESRIGLAVGGLFAAVGNKYIVESIVPTSTQNTLVDNLHNVTFLFILIIVAVVIYNTNVFVKGRELFSRKMDRIAFWSILLAYFIINWYLIYQASS